MSHALPTPRGGVLQLGGGNVAGGQPRRFRQLEDGLMRILMNIDAQRAVISLHAGGPGGGGGRRVGHVVRFPGFYPANSACTARLTAEHQFL